MALQIIVILALSSSPAASKNSPPLPPPSSSYLHSFMSKFAVMGRDAGNLLNRLSTANVDGCVGVITYTQWLNELVSRASSGLIFATNDDANIYFFGAV